MGWVVAPLLPTLKPKNCISIAVPLTLDFLMAHSASSRISAMALTMSSTSLVCPRGSCCQNVARVGERCPSPGSLEPTHGKWGNCVCTLGVIASRTTGVLPTGRQTVLYSPLLWEWRSRHLHYRWLQTILLVFQFIQQLEHGQDGGSQSWVTSFRAH